MKLIKGSFKHRNEEMLLTCGNCDSQKFRIYDSLKVQCTECNSYVRCYKDETVVDFSTKKVKKFPLKIDTKL